MATPPIFGPAINPNYNNQPAVDFANSPLMRDLRALGNSLSNYRDAAARRYFTSSLPDDASMLAKQVEQFRQAAVFPFAAAGDLVSSGAAATVPPAIEIAKGITGNPSIGSSAAPTASTAVPDLQLDAINDATQLSRQVDDTPSIDPAVVAGDNDAAVGDKQNWFDRINSKVDLMAMGAAMLANSGSGMGTAANFGKALQTGIASRAGQEKAAKDQQMAEALLLIRQQEALAKMAGDSAAANRLKNFTAARDVVSSFLQGGGAEKEGADVAAAQIIGLSPTSIVNLPPPMLESLTAYVAEKAGDNWFSSGGDIDQKKVKSAVLEFLQNLRGAR